MDIYSPHESKGVVAVHNSEGLFLRNLELSKASEFSTIDKVGIICAVVAQGKSLHTAATGHGWRLSVDDFLIQVASNQTCAEMFRHAKVRRVDFLVEALVDEKDLKEIKALKEKIASFREDLKVQKEEGYDSRKKSFLMGTFIPHDKQKKIRENYANSIGGRRAKNRTTGSGEKPDPQHILPDTPTIRKNTPFI